MEALLKDRKAILAKAKIQKSGRVTEVSKEDRARLNKIESEIGKLPIADDPEDMAAMDLIRRFAPGDQTEQEILTLPLHDKDQ